MDAKKPGDLVYLLGITKDELGGSEYYEIKGEIGLNVPKVDAKVAIKLYDTLTQTIEESLINSCHGIYKGGLAVALAQISFAGGYGLEIDLDKVFVDSLNSIDKILYSESASRFLVTVSPENKECFEKIIMGNIFKEIGKIREDEAFIIFSKGKPIIEENIYKLKESWQKTFKNF